MTAKYVCRRLRDDSLVIDPAVSIEDSPDPLRMSWSSHSKSTFFSFKALVDFFNSKVYDKIIVLFVE